MGDAPSEKVALVDDKPRINWMSEALMLAWIPVVAYFFAFTYESAYCYKLAVPLYLVNVDANTIAECVVASFSHWYILIIIISLLREGAVGTWNFGLWTYMLLCIVYLMTCAMEGVFFSSSQKYILAGVLVLLIGDIVLALFNSEKNPIPLFLRLKGFRIIMPDATHMPALNNEFGRTVYKLIGLKVLSMVISSSLGVSKAINTSTFLVSEADSSLILISVNDNKAVCSAYDPFTKLVLRKIVFVPLTDDRNTQFVEKKIGPLFFPQ